MQKGENGTDQLISRSVLNAERLKFAFVVRTDLMMCSLKFDAERVLDIQVTYNVISTILQLFQWEA